MEPLTPKELLVMFIMAFIFAVMLAAMMYDAKQYDQKHQSQIGTQQCPYHYITK